MRGSIFGSRSGEFPSTVRSIKGLSIGRWPFSGLLLRVVLDLLLSKSYRLPSEVTPADTAMCRTRAKGVRGMNLRTGV